MEVATARYFLAVAVGGAGHVDLPGEEHVGACVSGELLTASEPVWAVLAVGHNVATTSLGRMTTRPRTVGPTDR